MLRLLALHFAIPLRYAPAHVLEIVIDDKPARIAGSVADGDKPVGRAHVILLKWPVSNEDVFLSVRSIVADEDGKFQFAVLAPGEYRILAVAEESAEKLDEPHVLEQLLSGAERVTLNRRRCAESESARDRSRALIRATLSG